MRAVPVGAVPELPAEELDLPALLARVRAALAAAGRADATRPRFILGIVGPPGSGKSTLAERLADELNDHRVATALVPMDGFHLAQAELERLGRADRKGAPDTFDAAGYVALLSRLRDRRGVVYAPEFRREIEEPIAGAIGVPPEIDVVVTEGNYLLLAEDPWAAVTDHLDEAWYVDLPDDVRLERLIARHVRHGRSPEAARAWSLGPDQRNADLIAHTRTRADRRIRGR